MEAAVRWSPHCKPGCQRFLVVNVADPGLVLNEVDNITKNDISYHVVSRSGRMGNFGAFDWSKTDESTVALGHSSGIASLVKFRYDGQPCDTVAQFRIKQQRKCNSIAFSTQDWLAVAVDRARSDVCLFIYDANREDGGTSSTVRRLCAAEVVSSVRFFPSQPQEIVASTGRQSIRLYDLRDSGATGGNVQAPTKNVNNIAIDPLDENCFASAGSTDDPSVTVWDRRWMSSSPTPGSNSGAVFNFKFAGSNALKTTVWSLRYSGQRRGRLAVCTSTGELSVIDMVESKVNSSVEPGFSGIYPPASTDTSSNRYVSESRSLERPYDDVRYGRQSNQRIIAYDWMSLDSSLDGQGVLALRPSREADVLRVLTSKPMADITARNDLTVANSKISVVEPHSYTEEAPAKAPYEQGNGLKAEDFGPRDYDGESGTPNGRIEAFLLDQSTRRIGKVLATSNVQAERCRQGYLFDCIKNMDVVSGIWQLERLWEIINRFREQAADDGMVHGDLDFSYVGIAGLWAEEIGQCPRQRLSNSPARIEDAIEGLNSAKDIPAFVGERTNFPEHRQLCLAVCGWKFTTDSLEAECQELIERGLFYQAIVQAVLHDYKHIALNILRTLIRERTIANIGLGPLLASDTINEEQREMSRWMAADTKDPALKALLTFLDTGDWRDVMKTNYLHLGYRLALGLKYLNDTELSGFIESETARAVKNGDLEGILLTGLSEQSMELFQTYIARTNDLQTAVLATAFTNPMLVDDVRWNMWKETYFMQMQAWRCFIARTKFTVQHNHMAKTREGRSLIDPPPAQITLRCLHCQGNLARTDSSYVSGHPPQSSSGPPSSTVRVSGPPAHAGTVCPNCGRHMPRCGLCQMWLGTPNLSTPGGMRELSKLDNIMAKMICFCKLCAHGFHADHAKMWFEKHSVCPVPDCRCTCGLYG